MTAKPLYLVACSESKRRSPCAARDLYTSQLFKCARSFVERHGHDWRILSGLHGVLHPDILIGPYDQRPVGLAWREMVLHQLDEFKGRRLVSFAGPTYNQGLPVEEPLKGLNIGERKRWLLIN